MSSEDQTIIAGLWPIAETARQLGVTVRTVIRYERLPNGKGLPFSMIGGKKFHTPATVRTWTAAREQRLNPRRTGRGSRSADAGARP